MYNVHKIMLSILYYIFIEMHWYMCYNETIESIDNGEIQVKANVQGVTPQMFQKWGVITAIPPLGYRFSKGSDLVLDPLSSDTVRYIFDMYLIIQNLSDVARLCSAHGFTGQLGKPFTSHSVGKILRNPVYCGYRVFEGQLKPVQTPVIVSTEDFNEVQQLLAERNALVGRKRKKTTIRINETGE